MLLCPALEKERICMFFNKKSVNNILNVCVFCGSRSGDKKNQNIYVKVAKEIGKFLADNNINLIFGSGNTGLMGAVSDACLDNLGIVYGFTTKELMKFETPRIHKNHKLKILKTIQERKLAMLKKADAFIVLPGGLGTFDELFEVIVANQIGEIKKPIFIINVNDFYTYFYDYVFKNIIKSKFTNPDAIKLVEISDDVDYILNKIKKLK